MPKAWAILEKYGMGQNENPAVSVLPLNSDQKTNVHLKEIAKSCGIHKNITFHVAGHTFANTVTLSNGASIETVSKLLEDSKMTIAQIYVRVIER